MQCLRDLSLHLKDIFYMVQGKKISSQELLLEFPSYRPCLVGNIFWCYKGTSLCLRLWLGLISPFPIYQHIALFFFSLSCTATYQVDVLYCLNIVQAIQVYLFAVASF